MTESQIEAKRAAALALLRNEFPVYAPECLKIRTKSGTIVPFALNRIQLHIHARLNAQLERTGKVRAIILKGRQGGASTYIGGRFYHKTSMHRGIQTFILTHALDATDNLFAMVERFYKHNPIKPITSAANAKELSFGELESGYSVGTARATEIGRSSTIQLLHWSEVAFSQNASDHFSGLVQTVPDEPGTEIILESTANGPTGEFYQRWQQAEAGIGDYEAIFVPWFWSEEYRRPVPAGFKLDEEEAEYQQQHGLDLEQMVWRRAKITELRDPLKFKQEYPATAAEAFENTGNDSFIKAASVMAARKATKEGIGPLILGVDPSRYGDDRFSVAWRRGRKISKVESRDQLGTVEAVGWLKTIIDNDKPDRVFIDAGGGGDRIFDMMISWGAPYDQLLELVNFGGAAQESVTVMRDGTKRAGPKNRRAEMWLRSRDWLEQEGGADIPDSDALHSDAIGPGYKYDLTSQQLILESKDDMRKRKIRSPDEWDAVALTFASPVKPKRPHPIDRPRVVTIGSDSSGWMGS